MNLENELGKEGRHQGWNQGDLEGGPFLRKAKLQGQKRQPGGMGLLGGVSGTGDFYSPRGEFQGLKNLEGGTGTRAGLMEGGTQG